MDELKKALINFSLCLNQIELLIGQLEILIDQSRRDFHENGIRTIQYQEGESPLEEEIHTYMNYWSYSFEDVYDQFNVLVPHRLRSSVLLVIYGMFESEFDNLATIVLRKSGLPFSLQDFKNKGLTRSFSCIKKLINKEHVQEWNNFSPIIKLRNIAAHNNRLIKLTDFEKKDNIIKLLIKEKILTITDVYGSQTHDFIFTKHTLPAIKECMEQLYLKISVELKHF